MPPKKGKKGKKDDDWSDDEEHKSKVASPPSAALTSAAAAAAAAASPATGKGKGKAAAALAAAAGGDDDEDEDVGIVSTPKRGVSKPSFAGAANLFAMISTEDDASTANDDDAGSAGDFMAQILGAAGKKKGGKTSRKQQKELEFEQALTGGGNDNEDGASAAAEEAPSKKKDKKKGKKGGNKNGDDDDEEPVAIPATASDEQPEPVAAKPAGKKLSKKELREREFEAALDGVANPEDEKPAEAETAKAAPPKGKKGKKKSDADDEIDKLAEQIQNLGKGGAAKKPAAATAAQAAAPAAPPAKPVTAVAASVSTVSKQDDADNDDEEDDDADEATSADKKKDKKKQQQKKKKANEKPAPAAAAPKKPTAMGAALKAMLEKQKQEEEELKRKQEELERKQAEEEARLAEEERKKEEAKLRKKEKEKAKRDDLRAQGKLLSAAEKQRQQRNQQVVEMLKAQTGHGIVIDGLAGDHSTTPEGAVPAAAPAEAEKKKKPIYSNKKKTPAKKDEIAVPAAPASTSAASSGNWDDDDDEEDVTAVAAAAPVAVPAPAPVAGDDDWESKDMDDWEVLETKEIPAAASAPSLASVSVATKPASTAAAATTPAAAVKPVVAKPTPAASKGGKSAPSAPSKPGQKPSSAPKGHAHAPKGKAAVPAGKPVPGIGTAAAAHAKLHNTPHIDNPRDNTAQADDVDDDENEDDEDDEDGQDGSGDESEAETEEESDESESDSDSDEDDSEDDSDDETARERAAREAVEERKRLAKERREKRLQEALQRRSKDDLRSPICCVLGHVDTGKTKILDKIRQTNVQEGEAGGITQQIGATYIPHETILEKISVLPKTIEVKVPGLLVIDTPGHESFSNLRSRGSSLCNIAILVVDLMHGLEPQTIESINILKQRKTPFIVALNKIDRLFGWQSFPNNGVVDSLEKQKPHVKQEFETRLRDTMTAFAEQGLNAEVYFRNSDFRRVVSLVPTSAITGEGIPDMISLIVDLTQRMMSESLMYITEVEATVLEVKVIEGHGTTIDVILSNGVLREGDRICVCGLEGPIVTNIRALLTPQPLRELRVKGQYVHHKEVKASIGLKISAPGLEKAIAGSRLMVVGPDDYEDDVKEEVMGDLATLYSAIDKSGTGVWVQASTLGSLEALLEFLRTSKIPVFGVSIGPVHKKDVLRASIMVERKKEYALMLCFDIEVDRDAEKLAADLGVKIFRAAIIYHLFDQFTKHMAEIKEKRKSELAATAVFPSIIHIIPNNVFNNRSPIVVGVDVVEGTLRLGTPLCVPSRSNLHIGRVTGIEKDHKAQEVAKKGQSVAIKIELAENEPARMVGRHFEERDEIVSHISRESIDVLKEAFRDSMSKEDWVLVVKLKKLLNIP